MRIKPALIKQSMAMAILLASLPAVGHAQTGGEKLPAPGFHHLHLNSLNPEAAIDFYTHQFPSTMKSAFAGQPALKSGNVWVLFTKVKTAPPTTPQTAIWHFGWHVTDVKENLKLYRQRNVPLLPLYTGEGDQFVYASSDTWPGANGSLGRTRPEIEDAKAKGIQPTHGAGFAYLEAPDGAIIEYQGNMPKERFNHVHLFQHDPFCAQLWYEKHLNAPAPPPAPGRAPYTEANCKVPRPEISFPSLEKWGMLRQPAGVTFDDVSITWHVQQNETPLVPSRGHLYDHFALSVSNLDPWIAKLRRENVKFLESKPYKVGDSRAILIEGPSREAIELIEVK